MNWIKMLWNIGNDVQQKGWYASKTVWFNILSFVAALAAIKGFEIDANDVAVLASAIVALCNIVLRFTTNTPVGATKVVGAEVSAEGGDRVPKGVDAGGG
jgi:hypothetical protein